MFSTKSIFSDLSFVREFGHYLRTPIPFLSSGFFIGDFVKKKEANLIPLIEINIESKILLVRGKKVMLDRDLAEIYGVTTGNLNKAVRMNKKRFPENSIFRLSMDEYDSLGSQFRTLKKGRHLKYYPQAFTQEGIDILPGVLNRKRAIEANVQIMGTFNRLRETLLTYKDESFRDAFNIACNKKADLNELDTRRFLDVMQLIGDDTVDQIENFSASNKGILLLGGDYDLLCGTAAYIWYTHPLQYFVSGNPCIGNEWERSLLLHKDFTGHNEEEIRTNLFSQPDGLMDNCIRGTVLFLRDINTKHIDILERIARTIREFKRSREGGESCWHEYEPSIVIMNAKPTDELPEEFLRQFITIKLKAGKIKPVHAKTPPPPKKRGKKACFENKDKYITIRDKILKEHNKPRESYPSIDGLTNKIMKKMREEKLTKMKINKKTKELEKRLLYERLTIRKDISGLSDYKEMMKRKQNLEGGNKKV